jgi:hypothetical protein
MKYVIHTAAKLVALFNIKTCNTRRYQYVWKVTGKQFWRMLQLTCKIQFMDRDIVARIATRYGRDGPGIESLQGREFSHPSRPALVPTQPSVQ